MTVDELKEALEAIPGDVQLGVFVHGDPRGHELEWEGFNHREEIVWLRTKCRDEGRPPPSPQHGGEAFPGAVE